MTQQLANLAIICAQRSDVKLLMQRGVAYVQVGKGALSKVFPAQYGDNETIDKIIYELNFGAYAPQERKAA